MSNNDWTKRTAPEEHHLDGMTQEYSVAQWFNGSEGADGPLGHGGVELPFEYFKDMLAGQQPFEIPHHHGTKKVPGYLLQVMHLCIVQSHTSYYLADRIGKIIAWSTSPKFEEGYRSKTSYFCYAAEIEKTKPLTPFVLSVKSTIAKELKAMLRLFRSQILATANEFSGGQCPHYFFYVPLGTNGRVFFPDATPPYTIAPPAPYWDTQISDLVTEAQADILDELAIPQYLFDHIQAHGMDEAKAWRKTMENRGNNDSPPTSPPQGPPPSSPAPPPPTADEMELQQQQQLERERQQDTRAQPQVQLGADHGEEWEGRHNTPPPPPAPPMSEAQAVAHAHGNEAQPKQPALDPKKAEETFYSTVKGAIRSGQVSVSIINEYVKAAKEVGWPPVLSQLDQDIAAAAAA